MKSISAIYENGVFRPTGPVDLPEKCEVELELRVRGSSETERFARPIEDIIVELAAEVPPEAWDALPSDLTDQLDHYLYGSQKQ